MNVRQRAVPAALCSISAVLAIGLLPAQGANAAKVLVTEGHGTGAKEGMSAVSGEPVRIKGSLTFGDIEMPGGVDCFATDSGAHLGKNPSGKAKAIGQNVDLEPECQFSGGALATGDTLAIKSFAIAATGKFTVSMRSTAQLGNGCHYEAKKVTGTAALPVDFGIVANGTAKLARGAANPEGCSPTESIEIAFSVEPLLENIAEFNLNLV